MLREREEAISFNSGLEPGVSVIEEYVAGPYGSDSEVAIPIGNDARYLGGAETGEAVSRRLRECMAEGGWAGRVGFSFSFVL